MTAHAFRGVFTCDHCNEPRSAPQHESEAHPSVEEYLRGHADEVGRARSDGLKPPPMTTPEARFVTSMREAAAARVGYGWMQAIVEVEWNHQAPPAWGPVYFADRIRELEAREGAQRLGRMRLRDLLKSVEWGGSAETDYEMLRATCPSCGGLEVDPARENAFKVPVGHQEGCALAAALAESVGGDDHG